MEILMILFGALLVFVGIKAQPKADSNLKLFNGSKKALKIMGPGFIILGAVLLAFTGTRPNISDKLIKSASQKLETDYQSYFKHLASSGVEVQGNSVHCKPKSASTRYYLLCTWALADGSPLSHSLWEVKPKKDSYQIYDAGWGGSVIADYFNYETSQLSRKEIKSIIEEIGLN